MLGVIRQESKNSFGRLNHKQTLKISLFESKQVGTEDQLICLRKCLHPLTDSMIVSVMFDDKRAAVHHH